MAVIGAGYMGRRHAQKYFQHLDCELVAVVDSHFIRAELLAHQLSCRPFASTTELLDADLGLTAASVATPTRDHYATATELITAGIHCLVEKPLATSAEEGRILLEHARSSKVVLLPGHVERFNPAVSAVREQKPDIRYVKGYRVGPMSFRSIDSDVVKDVMIHDLDICCYLLGDRKTRVEVVRAVTAPEGLNDIANVHLEIGDCLVDLTASRLAVARRRKLRLFTADGYYSIDCDRQSAIWLSRDRYLAGLRRLKFEQDMGHDPSGDEIFAHSGAERIAVQGTDPGNDPLARELRYFLERIRGEKVEATLEPDDGIRVLGIAEQILSHLDDRNRLRLSVGFR